MELTERRFPPAKARSPSRRARSVTVTESLPATAVALAQSTRRLTSTAGKSDRLAAVADTSPSGVISGSRVARGSPTGALGVIGRMGATGAIGVASIDGVIGAKSALGCCGAIVPLAAAAAAAAFAAAGFADPKLVTSGLRRGGSVKWCIALKRSSRSASLIRVSNRGYSRGETLRLRSRPTNLQNPVFPPPVVSCQWMAHVETRLNCYRTPRHGRDPRVHRTCG